MASPDLKIAWAGSCSALWNNFGIGLRNNASITSLVFRQETLGSAIGNQIYIDSCSAITSISFPNLTSISQAGLLVYNCAAITTIDMPVLGLCTPANTTSIPAFYVTGNPLLTTINFPNLIPDLTILGSFTDYNFTNNALNQATVDMILARLLANPNVTFGIIGLDGGTNSAPSAQGTADKLALAARGCTVNTN